MINEVIIIDNHKKLQFFDDRLVFFRTDVISEEFKEQVFPFEKIKMAVIKPKEKHWKGFFWESLFALIFDANIPNIDGEHDRLKLIFTDRSYRFIDMGKLPLDKIREIRNTINLALSK